MIKEICLGFWSLYYCCFCSIISRDLYNEYSSNNNSNNEIDNQYPNYITTSNIDVSQLFSNSDD